VIFIKIIREPVVQVGDKTRLDLSGTFIISTTSATITSVEIDPDNTGTFYDTGAKRIIDWAYSVNGTNNGTVRVTDSAANVETQAFTTEILNESEDNLFSSDSDITAYEPDILKWVQDGRNSYLNMHRNAQTDILAELDASRIWKRDGERYTKDDIVDVIEFQEWSKFLVLRTIFEGLSNDVNDIFNTKMINYRSLEVQAKKRATFRLDSNGDGEITPSESVDNLSGYMYRR